MAARLLRGFAFSLAILLGAAFFYAPQLRELLGSTTWLATLLPDTPLSFSLWLFVIALNAAAALYLADYFE